MPARVPADQCPNSSLSPVEKYYVICTPSGKLCPNGFPRFHDLEDSEEEERNDLSKGEDNFSACLDWDTDLEEQDRKKLRNKKQKG